MALITLRMFYLKTELKKRLQRVCYLPPSPDCAVRPSRLCPVRKPNRRHAGGSGGGRPLPARGEAPPFRRQHGGRRGAGLRGGGGAGRCLAVAQRLLPQQGRGSAGVVGRSRVAGPRRPSLRPLSAALRLPSPTLRAAARPPRRLPPYPLRLRLPRRRLLPPAGPAGAALRWGEAGGGRRASEEAVRGVRGRVAVVRRGPPRRRPPLSRSVSEPAAAAKRHLPRRAAPRGAAPGPRRRSAAAPAPQRCRSLPRLRLPGAPRLREVPPRCLLRPPAPGPGLAAGAPEVLREARRWRWVSSGAEVCVCEGGTGHPLRACRWAPSFVSCGGGAVLAEKGCGCEAGGPFGVPSLLVRGVRACRGEKKGGRVFCVVVRRARKRSVGCSFRFSAVYLI